MKPSYPAWGGAARLSRGGRLSCRKPYILSASELVGRSARLLRVPVLFRPNPPDETNQRRDETIFSPFGALAKNSGNRRFVSRHQPTRGQHGPNDRGPS